MSAPSILSTAPINQAIDVVLGSSIILTFDQAIDTTSLNEQTFSLTGPGQPALYNEASEMLENRALQNTGREYITGTFTFDNTNSIATFTPSKPLRPGVKYDVLVVGAGAALTSANVTDPTGIPMAESYQFSFHTGILNLRRPPIQSPVLDQQPRIAIDDIIVRPKAPIDNDLTKQIEIIFPDDIDINSFDPTDIEVGIEAILNDPTIRVPRNLTSAITVSGNTITVVISGWPTHWRDNG